jgi:hypothetical protein
MIAGQYLGIYLFENTKQTAARIVSFNAKSQQYVQKKGEAWPISQFCGVTSQLV